MANPIILPTPHDAVRVFAGYRRAGSDQATFYKELGEVFMPGTPAMLAPLGLSAYVPAVLDLDAGVPDEVALIIYASRPVYEKARSTVQGRMYTHSHAGVFDMSRSRGQWSGTTDAPDKLNGEDRAAWRLFDDPVDWQQGETRLLFLTATNGSNLQTSAIARSADRRTALRAAGVQQAIGVATPTYAALWLHGYNMSAIPLEHLDLVPADAKVGRDITATPVAMPNGVEGPTIAGAGAFTFRFVREQRFFL